MVEFSLMFGNLIYRQPIFIHPLRLVGLLGEQFVKKNTCSRCGKQRVIRGCSRERGTELSPALGKQLRAKGKQIFAYLGESRRAWGAAEVLLGPSGAALPPVSRVCPLQGQAWAADMRRWHVGISDSSDARDWLGEARGNAIGLSYRHFRLSGVGKISHQLYQ